MSQNQTQVDEVATSSLLLSSLVRLTKSLVKREQLDELSFSAQKCASWRALETMRPDALIRDPYAETLAGPVAMSRAREMGQPRLPRLSVRTRHFDDFATCALAHSTQLVLLGAGMDMRAYRLSAVGSDTRVFEVDMASVIDLKEELLSRLQPPPEPRGKLVRVRADVTADWVSKVCAVGFAPGERTVWLVEGLVYYLTETQVDELFTQLLELSGKGSVVCFSAVTALNKKATGLASMFKSCIPNPEPYLSRFGWKVERVAELGGPEANYGRWPTSASGAACASATIYVSAVKP